MRTTIEISSPPIEPITTEEAKTWFTVGGGYNGSFDNTLVDSLIVAARENAEDYTQKPFIIREFKTTYDKCENKYLFSGCSNFYLELPKQPITSIASVQYYDTDNVEQTVDSAYYYFDSKKIIFSDVSFENMRDLNSFSINYNAGFGSTMAEIPSNIKTAIKYYLSDLYNMHISYRGDNADMAAIKPDSAIGSRGNNLLSNYIGSSFFFDGEAA